MQTQLEASFITYATMHSYRNRFSNDEKAPCLLEPIFESQYSRIYIYTHYGENI